MLSELTSAKLPSGVVDISGSFLAIMLASVLLGGTPGAIVGALTIGVGWFSTRERADLFRHNLLTFIWFPLFSGLLFHVLTSDAGINVHDKNHFQNPTYYLIVFATFMFALILNFGSVVGLPVFPEPAAPFFASCRSSSRSSRPNYRPPSLTLVAVYLDNALQIWSVWFCSRSSW